MKGIINQEDLNRVRQSNQDAWVLLFKSGFAQSDTAVMNLTDIENKVALPLFSVDVREVKDIHPEFGISSVPCLLHFKQGQLKNIIKGAHSPEQYRALIDKNVKTDTQNGEVNKQANVIVYTTPTCSWCTTIKRHLQEHQVRFTELNVAENLQAAREMIKKSGQQGVPQTEINGQMIVGFDKQRINSLLGIA
jgi:glutaredoxin-like YruB-family protein